MKYLVEIIPESITDMEAAVQNLAGTLKLDPAKAANLLKRNPITKPVSQAEAEKVARLFTKAGIEVFVRAEDESIDAPVPIPGPVQQVVQSVDTAAPMTENPVSELKDVPSPTTTAMNPVRFTDPGLSSPNLSSPNLSSPDLSSPELNDLGATPTHDPFAVKSVQGEETHNIPSGFFTPVPDGAVTPHSESSSPDLPLTPDMTAPRPQSGLGKIAFASIVPGLLALAGIFSALSLLGLPFLQSQQRASAETAAVSLASSLGSWIGDVSLDNAALAPQVQNVIARTQGELRGHNVDFVLLSDTEGNQLAGWYKDAQVVPAALLSSAAVRAQITNATGGVIATIEGTPLGSIRPNTRLTFEGETLGLAASAVQQSDVPVGSVVVGVSEQPLMARVRSLLPTLVLAGVLPLLLGILLSLLIGRNRTPA